MQNDKLLHFARALLFRPAACVLAIVLWFSGAGEPIQHSG